MNCPIKIPDKTISVQKGGATPVVAPQEFVGRAKKLPQHERMRSWKEAVALNRELKSWQQQTDGRRKHIHVN